MQKFNFLAKKINLPIIPFGYNSFFEKKNLEIKNFKNYLEIDSEGYGPSRDFTDITGLKKSSITSIKFHINEKLNNWLKVHISDKYHRAVILVNKKNIDNSSNVFSVHTDATRTWVLIYYIKTGGNSAVLNYFKEEGYNIIRGKNIYPDDYRNLKIIESFHPNTGEWWLLNTQALHDVQNLESDRMSIQLSFNDDTVSSIKCFDNL
jgi:hypothetical protein